MLKQTNDNKSVKRYVVRDYFLIYIYYYFFIFIFSFMLVNLLPLLCLRKRRGKKNN